VADKSAADIRTRTHGECGLSATFARTRSYRLADPYDPSVSPRAKHELARELHARGVLLHDFSDILRLLNEGRKVATCDGDEPDLEGKSLEDIAADVETAVELAEWEAAS
jgi:hypothetical protein